MMQVELEPEIRPAWYVQKDGALDTVKLMRAFQEFFSAGMNT